MVSLLMKAWNDLVQPMVQRPMRVQVAAVCYRGSGKDKQVLVITSRDTKRWILPKGWPIDGLDAHEAAAQEAWEEAGVKPARVDPVPMGSFEYEKRLDGGLSVPCDTKIFAIEVDHLQNSFPEANERERKWVTPLEAAELVDEPELKQFLREFAE